MKTRWHTWTRWVGGGIGAAGLLVSGWSLVRLHGYASAPGRPSELAELCVCSFMGLALVSGTLGGLGVLTAWRPRRFASALGVLTLASLFAADLYDALILPKFENRAKMHFAILSGRADGPYRYRVFMPLAAEFLQRIGPGGDRYPRARFDFSYVTLDWLIGIGLFAGVLSYFQTYISGWRTWVGAAVLLAVMRSGVTGHYMEGDFLNLLVFAWCFAAFRSGRAVWIVPLVGIGSFNRVQTVYAAVFYAAYAYSRGEWRTTRTAVVFAGSILAWASVAVGLRVLRGPAPGPGLLDHLRYNSSSEAALMALWYWSPWLPLLLAGAALEYRRADAFLRYSLWMLIPYTIAYVLLSKIDEPAKALPIYLVLIPMAFTRHPEGGKSPVC